MATKTNQTADDQNLTPMVEPMVEPMAASRFINLKTGYRGEASREQWIEPGIYSENDPALFGLAEYLVSITVAEWSQ